MSTPLPYNRHNALASTIASDLTANIAGKIVLTTGVTQNGLGATFVEEIAKHNPALLILAGRTASKIQATITKIKSNPASAHTPIRMLLLNLSSQTQIRRAAQQVLAYPEHRIDVLVNSAGIMGGPYATTCEGYELQFGSNHLGHFLFTNLIMGSLVASAHPRIVSVASDGHRLSGIRFQDVNFQKGAVYEQWEAYGQSKTANILFAKGLAARLSKRGVRAYSLHPGVAMGTSLAPQGLGDEDLDSLKAKDEAIGWTSEFDFKTLDECAATHVVAAFDDRLEAYNGAYLEDGNLGTVEPTAAKPEDVDKLWKLSEDLVGETFAY